MKKRNKEKCYSFEEEATVGRFFIGLACIERHGVPNRNVNLSMSNVARLVIPFAGEMKMVA